MSGKAGSSTSKALAIIEPDAPAEAVAEPRFTDRFTKETVGVVGGAIGVLALCLLTTALVTSSKASETVRTSCAGPQMSVAAAPQIATVLRHVLDDAGCKDIQVKATDADDVLKPMALGGELPDVWIPDSSHWRDRIKPAVEPVTLRESIATSPVVLVAGDGLVRKSYAEAFADDDLLVGDPQRMMSALGTVVAGRANPADAAKLEPYAKRIAADSEGSAPTDSARLAQLRTVMSGVTATSEQQWSTYAPMLKASAPKEGTVVLDFPVVITAEAARRNTIAASITNLARVLDSGAAAKALTASGFRTGDAGKPSPNVGTFTEADPATVKKAAAEWTTKLRPTRALAAIDVSGSMAWPARGTSSTRMQLTQAAASEVLKDLPGSAAIGLWAFSEEAEGKLGADHAELVPTRSLASNKQRSLLEKEIAGLTARTGGGTALHDTALAAYEAAVASYDPLASNDVLLFTDGTNEDAGSVDLPGLVRQLKAASDPSRPVHIIGIGITADADMGALRTIAETTGGAAHVAERPEDVEAVLERAISQG